MRNGIASAFFIGIAFIDLLVGQDKGFYGSLNGTVEDAETRSPLYGAVITLENTGLGTSADREGTVTIRTIPVGHYIVKISFMGYESRTISDVVIKPDRTTQMNIGLKQRIITTDAVTVSSGFFSDGGRDELTAQSFNYEEIRRAPGSAGDISRILFSMPSTAKVDDQKNSLIVRGGSPIENAFFIDDIEVPNINHFPSQGATGGAISYLNVDLISSVEFSAGGFGVEYGDKLSSVVDIRFRNGNTERFEGQCDFSLMGIGAVLEGPLFSEKGSWLISYRKSYVDFIVKHFNVGNTIAPQFDDFQFKASYRIHPQHTLTLLTVGGYDYLKTENDQAEENAMTVYARQDILEQTTGLNLRSVWSPALFTSTSLSLTTDHFDEDYYETTSQRLLFSNRSTERTWKFRSVTHWKINDRSILEAGIEAKRFANSYNNNYAATANGFGDTLPAASMSAVFSNGKAAGFLKYRYTNDGGLSIIPGVRFDYFDYDKRFIFSPRIQFRYEAAERISVHAAAGYYRQSLPPVVLISEREKGELDQPQAVQLLLGCNFLLSDDARLTVEVYDKRYRNFPLDQTQPELFIIDELQSGKDFLQFHKNMLSAAEARTYGVEAMIQKKMSRSFYGVVSGTWFRSIYTDGRGIQRNRTFDNQYIFTLAGGYRLSDVWELSARWVIAGGIPYTPLDEMKSSASNAGMYDESRVNGGRYPAYHSLNARIDRRFNFERSSIILFLSIWNAYDHKNIAGYYWNKKQNKQDVIYQWGLLPILGFEWEF